MQKNENSKKETGGPGFPAGRARLARRRRLGVELSGGSGVDGAAGCSATQCIYGKKSRRDVTAHAAGARREPQRVLRAWVGSCASRHLERLKELTGALVSNCSALEAKFDSPPRFCAHLPKKTVGRTVLKVPGYPRGHTFCSLQWHWLDEVQYSRPLLCIAQGTPAARPADHWHVSIPHKPPHKRASNAMLCAGAAALVPRGRPPRRTSTVRSLVRSHGLRAGPRAPSVSVPSRPAVLPSAERRAGLISLILPNRARPRVI